MDANTLRGRILQHITNHDATGLKGLCTDDELATAMGASVEDVHQQLEILQAEGLVELFDTFRPGALRPAYTTRLTP